MAAPRTCSSHETERMRELDGVVLATFPSRALAFLIDFLLASAFFLAALIAAAKIIGAIPSLQQDKRHIEIELNFFHNWYSVLYLVIFFGRSLYWGKGANAGETSHAHSSGFHRASQIVLMALRRTGARLWCFGLGPGIRIPPDFIHPNRRTVHDRIDETIVIRDNRAKR